MKKALTKKLAGPSKLVRRALFRQKSCNANESRRQPQMIEDASGFVKEIEALKDQVANLKAAITTLQIDIEHKEVRIAKLARDKERLAMELSKVRRSNTNLTQQLEDERRYYYKEKEDFCHEMNEVKKLKKTLSQSNVASRTTVTHDNNNSEINKMKKTVEKTLQTNYNLSIKFLRMKETKDHIAHAFKKAEEEHSRVVEDLKTKVENLTVDLNEVVKKKYNSPTSPSDKKYLQLVNQNSSLVYENLCLQRQVDQLNLKMRKNKLQGVKSETSSRTKVGNRDRHGHKAPRMRTSENSSIIHTSNRIIKIFEREKKPGVPTVTILNEREITSKKKHSTSAGKLKLPEKSESKLTVFQVSEIQSSTSTNAATVKQRSRSAPKIMQSVTFKNETLNKNRHKSCLNSLYTGS